MCWFSKPYILGPHLPGAVSKVGLSAVGNKSFDLQEEALFCFLVIFFAIFEITLYTKNGLDYESNLLLLLVLMHSFNFCCGIDVLLFLRFCSEKIINCRFAVSMEVCEFRIFLCHNVKLLPFIFYGYIILNCMPAPQIFINLSKMTFFFISFGNYEFGNYGPCCEQVFL